MTPPKNPDSDGSRFLNPGEDDSGSFRQGGNSDFFRQGNTSEDEEEKGRPWHGGSEGDKAPEEEKALGEDGAREPNRSGGVSSSQDALAQKLRAGAAARAAVSPRGGAGSQNTASSR